MKKDIRITYNCECDAWLKVFTKLVLQYAEVETEEFCVVAVDDRRIHLEVKACDIEIAQVANRRPKEEQKKQHWVIKYEWECVDRVTAVFRYVLFDWTSCETNERILPSGNKLLHMVPKFIDEGEYRLINHEDDKAIEIRRVKYVDKK